MRSKPLIWYLYPSFFLITLFCIVGASWFTSSELSIFYQRETIRDLKARAQLIREHIIESNYLKRKNIIENYCRKMGTLIGTRITLILPNGKVIGDSHKDPSLMDNHGDRPEILQAYKTGSMGSSKRFSHTLNTTMVYVALPIIREGKLLAYIRTSRPLSAINKRLETIQGNIIIGTIITLMIAALLCFLIARKITSPLKDLTIGAKKFARGNLKHKIVPLKNSFTEMNILANAMNKMAGELKLRFRTIEEQKNELEAILSSINEGILAIDQSGEIVIINDSAKHLFSLDKVDCKGAVFEELIRNSSLRQMVMEILEKGIELETEITIHNNEDKLIHCHGSPINFLKETYTLKGVVIALSDITKVKKMERVRKDFVANVSHELKTPITTIKGFVETLLSGDVKSKEKQKRFIQIIEKHVDRLNFIVEDLLILSKLEENTEKRSIDFTTFNIHKTIETAIEACTLRGNQKGIKIVSSIKKGLNIQGNPHLIEQVIINLVDNAIKFSPPNSSVYVRAENKSGKVWISVEDNGVGIPQGQLDRIFERFYRVDKGRSRQMGGTGLGLSIVKHVVELHGGAIEVKSQLNKGSIFTVIFPSAT